MKEENFEKCLKEIYSLVSILYSDFPIYKNISYDDFYILFKDMKKILDFNMVKMAYFNEKAVGFFISIPKVCDVALPYFEVISLNCSLEYSSFNDSL